MNRHNGFLAWRGSSTEHVPMSRKNYVFTSV